MCSPLQAEIRCRAPSAVQWSAVARLESDQLFLVQTEERRRVYTGKLSTAGTPGERPHEYSSRRLRPRKK